MTQRAAVYIRMSTDNQADSPERQRSQVMPYCQRKGYEVVRTYEDHGMRGWDSSRPEFRRLLEDAQKGRFDVIVFDEQSRLSRLDPLDFCYRVAGPLREAGVTLEAVDKGPFNWDEIGGFFLWTLGQHSASAEVVKLGRLTATGMVKKAKEGKMFVGRAPYGYRYNMVEKERVGLEPDTDSPEKAEVVRRIFDAYVNRDMSLIAIVAELNSLGIASPQGCPRWGKTTVHNLLTNHVYAGSFVWGKVAQGKYSRTDGGEVVSVSKKANKSERRSSEKWLIIPGQHEPLVAPELFDRVQELLVANRLRTSPSRKKAMYPLSQLLRCSHCGQTMHGTTRRKEPVYRCSSNMNYASCAPRVVTERAIIEHLAGVLEQRLLDPVERERLETEIRRQSEQRGGLDEKAVKEQRGKLAKLEANITKATKNLPLLDSEYIPETQAQIRRWKQERETVQGELDRLTRQSPAGSVDRVVGKVEKFVEVMKSGDPALVRSVARETIGRVDLRFEEVPKTKLTRYPLAGGVVHLVDGAECADSSTSGPAAARSPCSCSARSAPGCIYSYDADRPNSRKGKGSSPLRGRSGPGMSSNAGRARSSPARIRAAGAALPDCGG